MTRSLFDQEGETSMFSLCTSSLNLGPATSWRQTLSGKTSQAQWMIFVFLALVNKLNLATWTDPTTARRFCTSLVPMAMQAQPRLFLSLEHRRRRELPSFGNAPWRPVAAGQWKCTMEGRRVFTLQRTHKVETWSTWSVIYTEGTAAGTWKSCCMGAPEDIA